MDESQQGTLIHPPYGTLELVSHTASDLQVVNSARVSLAQHSDFEPGTTFLKSKDVGLIDFLMKNRHGTPFEQGNFFTWRVKAPIFVFREWHRHRVGWSYNEMSGRYTKLRPEFYVPATNAIREQHGKPGAYTFLPMMPHKADTVRQLLAESYNKDWGRYEALLEEGVAKEVARLVLPVAIYSEMYATCNARSLMNFLSLRAAPTAMREIREYAEAMLAIFTEVMPVTAACFVKSELVAP